MHKRLSFLIICIACFQAYTSYAEIELPDLGSPSDAYLSKMEEPAIGRAYYRNLRQQEQVVEDPLLSEYIQNLGEKLSSKVQDGDFNFNYFFVPQTSINAFALPGGYIGANIGLCLNSDNESQFASVLSHEISHVTQRHISRQVGDQVPNTIQGGLVLLGAVLLSAISGSSEILEAGTMLAPSIMQQGQIDFTREMEVEADAVGIKTLAMSGYDPFAMAEFFNKLSTGGDPRNAASIEFLRTHPTSVNRSAAAKKQARRIEVKRINDSLVFELTKARIRFLYTNSIEKSHDYFLSKTARVSPLNKNLSNTDIGNLYGLALTSIELSNFDQAQLILDSFIKKFQEYNHFHLAYAKLLLAKNNRQQAIVYLKSIISLSPRNIPLTLYYSEVELNYGSAEISHETLLDLFNNVAPSPLQIKLIARAANASGEYAESFSYMGEYYLSIGMFKEAIEQIKIALTIDSITNIQIAKFVARLSEIEDYLENTNNR
ncbi:MAG: M48 family metalloprotease [Gammaproteobacteria bacterium]|nr:M48 family metalloprotease [Gammaproteobacteria bacterium]